MSSKYNVVKSTGESVPFDEEKLVKSLRNAGAGHSTVDTILTKVKADLYDGIPTRSIYKTAHQLLRKQESIKASRYKLKQAILELGPTGYPFELFIGALMKSIGYTVETGIMLEGRCVSHEIDVLAQTSDEIMMIECKFHNRAGYKTDVKVPLYIDSRFRDLEAVWKNSDDHSEKRHKASVVTNGKLTGDAIKYGTCAGITMLSWEFPENKSLKDLVDRNHLYPVTSLQSLSKNDKKLLVEEGVVVIRDLCENFNLLDKLRLSNSVYQKVVTESNLICDL